nr:uncharacterized protein LOC127332439 [Lolium perenne]
MKNREEKLELFLAVSVNASSCRAAPPAAPQASARRTQHPTCAADPLHGKPRARPTSSSPAASLAASTLALGAARPDSTPRCSQAASCPARTRIGSSKPPAAPLAARASPPSRPPCQLPLGPLHASRHHASPARGQPPPLASFRPPARSRPRIPGRPDQTTTASAPLALATGPRCSSFRPNQLAPTRSRSFVASNRSKPGGTPGHPVETGAQTGAIRCNPGAPSGPGPGLDRARQSQIRFDRVLDRFDPVSSNFDSIFCPKF